MAAAMVLTCREGEPGRWCMDWAPIEELATCPFLGGAGLRYWGHTPQPSAPKGMSIFLFIYVILTTNDYTLKAKPTDQ